MISPDWIQKIFSALDGTFDLALKEVSLEANPESLSLDRLKAYRKLGINRLSLGVQTFSPELLKKLGRTHSPADAIQAYRWGREAGFDNISMDLISSLPGQGLDDIYHDLDMVERLGPDHISWYDLILEDRTYFSYLYNQGRLHLPGEDLVVSMDQAIRTGLADLGFSRYELSNFAKPNKASLHNLKYWLNQDFLGLGLGAASCIRHRQFSNTRDLKKYISQEGRGEGVHIPEEEGEVDRLFKQVMMGLRLVRGIDRKAFKKDNKVDPLDLAPKAVKKHKDLGNLAYDSDRLYLTPRGLDLQNRVLVDILLEMEEGGGLA